MKIELLTPLSNAWQRTLRALFKPFDIKKWLIVGFTVFLADLTKFHGGSGSYDLGEKDLQADRIFDFPEIAINWLFDNPVWFSLIIVGVILLIILAILFTWLSSRGQFMFLYNVIEDEALISKPWYDYKTQANSLFIWRLVFGFTCLLLFLASISLGIFIFYDITYGVLSLGPRILLITAAIFFVPAVIILYLYIYMLLFNFVVPIMYKFNLRVSEAWSRFLKIFKSHFGFFILYGIFVFSIMIMIFIAIMIIGLFTCCCGFLILMIPYISSVVLLPISYLFRSFSLYFLEQFGPEYKFFADRNEFGELQ